MVSVLHDARVVYCALNAAAFLNPIQCRSGRCSIRRYVIIGSGAAGISAVESIRNTDAAAEIFLLSEERHGYYSRPGLAYYLTGELNESQLYPFSAEDFKRLDVRSHHARVDRILIDQHRVEIQGGSYLGYDRLLVATGASAARANIPGVNLDGVVKLDTLADARKICSKARRRRTAVVVGGGITALEIVEGLRLDGGYVSQEFVNDERKNLVKFEDCLVLVANKRLDNLNEIMPVLEQVARDGRPLVIFAENIEGKLLAALIMNSIKGSLVSVYFNSPSI